MIGILYLLVAALLWSTLNVILRHVVGAGLHPFVVSSGLYLSAVLVLAPISFLLNIRSVPTLRGMLKRRPGLIVGLSKAGETISFIYAVKYITATQTVLLTKLNSVWTYLILWVLYRGDVRPIGLLGGLVAFSGVYLILGEEGGIRAESMLGSALAICSGLIFSVFSVSLEKDRSGKLSEGLRERLAFTTAFLTYALVLMLPMGIWFLPAEMPRVSDVLWIAVGGGVLLSATYCFYYAALTRLSSLQTVVTLSLTVPFTLFLERLFLEESVISATFVVGGVLIVAGAVVAMKARGRPV